jgi:hypothetical protein
MDLYGLFNVFYTFIELVSSEIYGWTYWDFTASITISLLVWEFHFLLKITTVDWVVFGVRIRRGFQLMGGYSSKAHFPMIAQLSYLLTALEEILVSI